MINKLKIVEVQAARFRIIIKDLQAKEGNPKSQTISLTDHENLTARDLKDIIKISLNSEVVERYLNSKRVKK
jgi:hypothetical protein